MSLLEKQPDKQFLLFESQLDKNAPIEQIPLLHSVYNHWFWSDRLVLIKKQQRYFDEFHYFIAFDLLMNEHKPIFFHKIDNTFSLYYIYSLNTESGFIVEEKNGIFRVNFVKIDWNADQFQLIEKFDFEFRRLHILIDKIDLSKFILRCYHNNREYHYQLGKLNNGKIEFGEIHQNAKRFDFYSKGRLINVKHYFPSQITIYDVFTKKEEKFKIDSSLLPRNVNFGVRWECVNDRLYTNIRFNGNKKYGIVWTDLEAKKWNLMEFGTSIKIEKLIYLNGNLIVNAKQYIFFNCPNKVKIFNIPMRKPNLLRYSAWLLVVQVMKNNGETDPYKAAKEFLPLNSDLREYWFKDEETQMEQMEIN